MEEIPPRDYAISAIEELKRARGKELFNLNGVFNMPHEEMNAFLLDEVYNTLGNKIYRSYSDGFLPIKYVMYFGFNNGKLIAFSDGEANLRGRISQEIGCGINEAIEEHENNPKALELRLYVKAAHEENLLIVPSDFFSRELVLN